MPIYMKYEGIEGEVTGRYKGWIALESCQMGVHRHVASSRGPKEGKKAEAPSVNEIVVTKVQDCSSVHLFRESLQSVGKKVTIDFVNGKEAPYMSLELENALVSSYSSSGSGGDNNGRPLESLSLNFAKISHSTKPTASAKKPQGAKWPLVGVPR